MKCDRRSRGAAAHSTAACQLAVCQQIFAFYIVVRVTEERLQDGRAVALVLLPCRVDGYTESNALDKKIIGTFVTSERVFPGNLQFTWTFPGDRARLLTA